MCRNLLSIQHLAFSASGLATRGPASAGLGVEYGSDPGDVRIAVVAEKRLSFCAAEQHNVRINLIDEFE